MRRNSIQLKRQWLVFQLAAAMGIAGVGTASADDYTDYFGTAKKSDSNVALTAGAYGDPCPCPPSPCPPQSVIIDGSGQAMSDAGDSSSLAPIPQSDVANFTQNTPATSSLAVSNNVGGNLGVPNMVGDFFGGSSLLLSPDIFLALQPQTVAVSGGDRRFKISDNVSPVPQDRVFFNYNHFHNAVLDANSNSTDVDRMVFGFEKTFLNRNASFEFRLPFASGLDASQTQGRGGEATEFGNLAFALKANLLSTSTCMISGGASMTVPTGSDYVLYDGFGNSLLEVRNDSYQLAPFLGITSRLNDDWFTQSFAQLNFDLSGYEVRGQGGTFTGLNGTVQEQHQLYLSSSLGVWLLRQGAGRNFQGVAAINELHYTTRIHDLDVITDGTNVLGNQGIDALNLTSALHFQNGPVALRVGGAAPLRLDNDKLFDAEFFVQINRFF